jgi:DNA-binding transcriptional MerR regulator
MRADLSSGDLARATGKTVRTVRFYEEEGILTPAEVSNGGHRRYTKDDLERLRLIFDLRELGLPLGEIRSVLDLRSGCDTAAELAARFEQVLVAHIQQAEQRLDRLRRVKRELTEALHAVQERLSGLTHRCPCAVAAMSHAPRIVRVIAKSLTCQHGNRQFP